MKATRFSLLVPWALTGLATLLAVTLAYRQRSQESEFREHRVRDILVQQGSVVPPFTSLSTNGSPVTIGEARSPETRQVIFLLTAVCPYCRETLPAWNEIARVLGAGYPEVGVYALSSDSAVVAQQYASSRALAFPVVTFPHRKYVELYRAQVVPQTLVVGHEGSILLARAGVLKGKLAIDSVIAAATRTPGRTIARQERPPAKPNRRPDRSLSL